MLLQAIRQSIINLTIHTKKTLRDERGEGDAVAGCISLIIMIALIAWGVRWCTAEPKVGESKRAAWRMAKEFVKEGLKSPGTASFPWYDSEFVEHVGDDEYRVASYVDAENLLGGTVRAYFVVEIRKDGDTWHLEDMDMHQRE